LPKIGNGPLTRIHIRIYPEDYRKLQELFNSDPNSPLMGRVLRDKIHEWLAKDYDRIRRIVDQNIELPIADSLTLDSALGEVIEHIKQETSVAP
jgi:hypothetical protein